LADNISDTRTNTRRTIIVVVVVAAILLGAGTFFAVRYLADHNHKLAAAPAVGSCWTTTFSSAQNTEDWEGAPAIACAKTHESYTYAVTRLGKTFSYASWLTSKNAIRSDVDRAAYSACKAQQKLKLPGLTTREALLYPTYYLPSVAQWGSGARWVRCDITLIRVGSTIAHPKLTALPAFAELTSTLTTTPAKYALCEDDPASNGPDGAQTTYADCTGPADYTFLAQLTMEGAPGVAYPGLAALTATGETQCKGLPVGATSSGHDIVAEPPLQLDWTKYGDRNLDCWLNNN
jgi:hypothetical protein